jgi:hypothetical protein
MLCGLATAERVEMEVEAVPEVTATEAKVVPPFLNSTLPQLTTLVEVTPALKVTELP